MIRRALAVVAALVVILAVLALWPPSTKSDQPVSATTVPASAFVAVGSGRSSSPGWVPTPGSRPPTAPPQPRTSPAIGSQPIPGPRGEHAGGTLPDVRVKANTDPHPRPSPESASISGTASWFTSPIGVSAAGPALRAAIGPGWRGTLVKVTGPHGFAWTVLGDWCACRGRLIDLDVNVFPAVCGTLSLGLCTAEVTW